MGVALYLGWLAVPVVSYSIGYWMGWRDGKGR